MWVTCGLRVVDLWLTCGRLVVHLCLNTEYSLKGMFSVPKRNSSFSKWERLMFSVSLLINGLFPIENQAFPNEMSPFPSDERNFLMPK